jgi:hypothetical protein
VTDDEAISREVRDFLEAYIHSVAQLEILLAVHAQSDRDWDAADLGRELSITTDVAEMHLEDLSARALLIEEGNPPRYRYMPPGEIKTAIEDLAHAYSVRRVAIIGLIFSKPVDDVRSFADAFRVRKGKRRG